MRKTLASSMLVFVGLHATLVLQGCGEDPPPKLPLTKDVTKMEGGNRRYNINFIAHPACPAVTQRDAEVLFNHGGLNPANANEVWFKDDDGPGKDFDRSVGIDIYIILTKEKWPERYNDDRYNNITSREDWNTLITDANMKAWVLFVNSMPAGELARGATGKARMVVQRAGVYGAIVAHELGHNAGLGWDGHRNDSDGTIRAIMADAEVGQDRNRAANEMEKSIMENPR